MPTNIFRTLDILSSSNRYNLWIYRKIRNHLSGTILDIGSGTGNIAQYYRQNKYEKIILSDRSDEMLSRLSASFSHFKDHHIVKMDIQDEHHLEHLPLGSMDTITCINVLEHTEDDEKALRNMHRLLKKDGKLLLLVPAFPWLYGTLDSFVNHFRRYTKNSLRKLFERTGFVSQEQYYMNCFGTITWFLSGNLLKLKSFNKEICKQLDGWVPFLEWIETFFHPPFGQSIITVLRKA